MPYAPSGSNRNKPTNTIKTYEEVEISELDVDGKRHAPAVLPPGIQLQSPLDRRLDWSQSLSGHCGEEKTPLSLPKIEPLPSSP
jgi:hypothetical protein